MKKIISAVLLLMLVMPFTVNAHTALTASSPVNGEVLAESPEELELSFGTVIEEGSSMMLDGPKGKIELDEITIEGNVMKGSLSEKLENGSYIILWKIIGEDGHPIEGEILFSLDGAAEEMVEEPVQEDGIAAEPASVSEKQTASSEENEEEGVLAILLLIAITVLVGFGSVLLIKMKR